MFHERCSTGGILPALLVNARFSIRGVRHRFGEPLPRVDEVGGAIFLGGSASANDTHHDWLSRERAWMEKALGAGIPQVGICLGGQMMASLLGARVHRLPGHSLECGYYPLAPETGSLLSPLTHVYQWHREQFDLPGQATLLATGGELCPVQAFSFGPLLALQFHPEVDDASIDRWHRRDGADLAAPNARPAPTHLDDHARHAPVVSRWVKNHLLGFLASSGA